MTPHEKMQEILKVEKVNIEIHSTINWKWIENTLKRLRLEKYGLWMATGKVFPEAGQISPALAHNGRMKIMSQ
ncbi:hypothetical protein [Providencia manganoxydans]|uniref:hypothetical protein n=1 Tax=Providencia manganoxydans TaxID=2923283 RepID=UPI0029BFD7B6|nr:hypothetical protein [Providencia manganoxydans]MDX4944359.1 hypothetical protein [Providencia manganoxydans]